MCFYLPGDPDKHQCEITGVVLTVGTLEANCLLGLKSWLHQGNSSYYFVSQLLNLETGTNDSITLKGLL